jgi:hypothetical protein
LKDALEDEPQGTCTLLSIQTFPFFLLTQKKNYSTKKEKKRKQDFLISFLPLSSFFERIPFFCASKKKELAKKRMNTSSVLRIETNIGPICHAYLDAYEQLQKSGFPDGPFGCFSNAKSASSYAQTRLLLMFIGPALIAFFSCMEFIPWSEATRRYFKLMRILEAIVYGAMGIATASLLFAGKGSCLLGNVMTMTWLGMSLLFILNSLYIAAAFHHKQGWMERIIDFNWMLFAALLMSQIEGTFRSTWTMQLAGLFLFISLIFSPAAQRYIQVDNEKKALQRTSCSLVYVFQTIAFIFACCSNHSNPMELVVQHMADCPFAILLYIIYALVSLEFLLVLGAFAYFHFDSPQLKMGPRAPFLSSRR